MRVISQMYNCVRSLNSDSMLLPDLEIEFDAEMVVPGSEQFLQAAIEFYKNYVRDISGIMRVFGIQTEVRINTLVNFSFTVNVG